MQTADLRESRADLALIRAAAQARRYIEMKTIKLAIWLNILFFVVQLCGSAWAFSTILTSPRFPTIPSFSKYIFIGFQIIGHSLPILCIIGLALKKNWGRILTIVINILFFLFISIRTILKGIDIGHFDFPLSAVQNNHIFSGIYVLLLVYFTMVLKSNKAATYFAK